MTDESNRIQKRAAALVHKDATEMQYLKHEDDKLAIELLRATMNLAQLDEKDAITLWSCHAEHILQLLDLSRRVKRITVGPFEGESQGTLGLITDTGTNLVNDNLFDAVRRDVDHDVETVNRGIDVTPLVGWLEFAAELIKLSGYITNKINTEITTREQR